MNSPLPVVSLGALIRETRFALRRRLRFGHREMAGADGLPGRLRRQGVPVIQPHPLEVLGGDGARRGESCADRFMEERLLVELKAGRGAADEHVAP